VIDFEATCCDRGTVPRREMEIIEIGAVMADANDFRIVDEFQSFVRPQRHPALTAFCTRLTSIRQKDVDAAPTFPECVEAFKPWLDRYREVAFCSWGDYDRTQLRQDCDFHGIQNPISAPHRNVKRLFGERLGFAKKYGLTEALAKVGLSFAGTHHRGIDDARNIAALLPFVFGTAHANVTVTERA
jgi:inhibitor of KinA sporulation pathway (predicted exonuclease)